MDLFNRTPKEKPNDKPAIEMSEREKQEYKLIGSFVVTKGLTLFAYNHIEDKIIEVRVIKQESATIDIDKNTGKLHAVDTETDNAIVDARFEHFEALNRKNAEKRIAKYKTGKLKNLCNLRAYNPDGISFW